MIHCSRAILFEDIARIGVHAQAWFLPSGHEAGEPTVLRSRACQDRRFRFGQRDSVAPSVHRLRVHPVVSGARGVIAFDQLQHADRLVGRRLHHGRAVHVQTVVSGHKRDRSNIQNMLGPRHAR